MFESRAFHMKAKAKRSSPIKGKQQPPAAAAAKHRPHQGQLSPQKRQPAVLYRRQLSCLSLCRILVNLPTTHTHLTFFSSTDFRILHTQHIHTPQSCRQAKCRRSWRCPASSSRTALNSSTAARTSIPAETSPSSSGMHLLIVFSNSKPDKREFLKISQAVGVGFLVMGVIGYIVKLSMWLYLISR
jgi:protein translocase SEC61 complex gamma subunit